jgi:nucleoside-diphosphate-sugar epimerase
MRVASSGVSAIARTFARRFSVDICALRIGNVIKPREHARDFPK